MSTRLDFDQSGKNRASAIAQGVLIEQIARCVCVEVFLERSLIEFLFSTGNRNREHITPSPATDHSAYTFQTRIFPTEIEREIQYRGVAICQRRINLEGNKVAAPVLFTNIGQLRAWACNKVIDAAGEAFPALVR